MSTSMSSCNRDLCRRHVPAVVKAIEQLQQNQNDQPERPYLIDFSLTSADGNAVVSKKGQYSMDPNVDVLYYTFPMKYKTLFTASNTDPNRYIHMRIKVTTAEGVTPTKTYTGLLNLNAPLKPLDNPQYDSELYPDRHVADRFNKSKNVSENFNDLANDSANGGKVTTSPSFYLQVFASPLLSTADNGGTFTIYLYGLGHWIQKMGASLFGKGNPVPNAGSDDMESFLCNNVTIDAFNVSALYTPSNLP